MNQVYKTIPVADSSAIRLLELHPDQADARICVTLKAASLADPDIDYEALSYTWGSWTDAETLICNGQNVLVTRNLYSALRRLRNLPGGDVRTFWIDALCINQEDVNERASQVMRMLQIYRKSWRLTIDLGEAPENMNELFELIKGLHNFNEQNPDTNRAYTEEDVKAAGLPAYTAPVWATWQRFLSRPYFRRTWVIQEFAVGRDALCFLDKTYFPWWNLFQIIHGMDARGIGEQHRTMPADSELAQSAMKGRNALHGLHARRLSVELGETQKLTTLLWFSRFAETTDPKDKVFGILGLATDIDHNQSGFKVSYEGSETLAALFTRVAKALVETSVSNVQPLLSEAGYALRPRNSDLPSWIPDWSVPRAGSPLADLRLYHTATEGQSIDCHIEPSSDILHIKGIIVDKIAFIGSDYRPELTQARSSIDYGISSFIWLDEAYKLAMQHFPSNTAYVDTGEDMITPLWRTLIGDKTHGDQRAPSSYAEQYQALLTVQRILINSITQSMAQTSGDTPATEPEPNSTPGTNTDSDLVIVGHMEAENQGQPLPEPEEEDTTDTSVTSTTPQPRTFWIIDPNNEYEAAQQNCQLFRLALQNMMYTKRFVVTEKGRFGIVPGGAGVGDSICVFRG